jgi:signal transduction protein with GAF and PtsI domain
VHIAARFSTIIRRRDELGRLAESIATGQISSAILAAIHSREARVRAMTDKLLDTGPNSFQEKLDDLRDFAVRGLNQIRELLSRPSEVHEARALLAEPLGKLSLKRTCDGYSAIGEINFFGE